MKKIGLLLCVLMALLTASCSNILVSDGDGGSISLVIDGITAQSIRSAGAMRNVAAGTSYSVTVSLIGDYETTITKTLDSGSLAGASFTFENIPVDKEVRLVLEVKVDGSMTWYGCSSTHRVKSGVNTLQIAVGRVSGVLMWKHDTENSSNSYKIVPYGAYNNAGVSLSTSSSSLVWCFDNAGNIYWYADGENGAQRYDIQADGTYRSSEIYYYAPPFSALSYDNVTDILYGIGDGGSLKYWQKTGGASSDIYGDDGGMVSVPEPLGFAVHNNIAYVANFSQIEEEVDGMMSKVAKVTVSKYDVSDVTSSPTTNEIKLPENFVSSTFSAPTGQMIYKDGALYLLLGSFSVSSSTTYSDAEVQSCGALLRINPSTLTLDTSFGNNGYLGLVSERTISGTYISDKYSMKLYSPTESDESRAFYGPVGFVAVMPKKLVIADAGYALSKGSNNELRARRKNRVVTVDLETQAFDVASLSDITFYGNITTGCGFLDVE